MVSLTTSSAKWLKCIVFTMLFIFISYLLAALAGSIFPANQSWQSPDDGIQLYIETNGLHTGIIMPIRSDVYDWSTLIRPEHLPDPSRYGSHILVGWGHEGVYRHAEKWTDLRSGDALSAMFGSDNTLLHVYHLHYPQPYPHFRRSIKVSEAQYLTIAKAVAAKIVLDRNGQPSATRGYGEGDLFYRSHGTYNAFNTCNNWTSRVLRQAGIRTGLWTPFQGGVMRWVPEE